jgi:hypothetical protein
VITIADAWEVRIKLRPDARESAVMLSATKHLRTANEILSEAKDDKSEDAQDLLAAPSVSRLLHP